MLLQRLRWDAYLLVYLLERSCEDVLNPGDFHFCSQAKRHASTLQLLILLAVEISLICS